MGIRTARMEAIPGQGGLKTTAATGVVGTPTQEMAELQEIDPKGTKEADQKQTVLVTGHAGFIGYHTTKALLERGDKVIGFDNLNTHYDTRLKHERLAMLEEVAKATGSKYHSVKADLCSGPELMETLETYKVQRVIHLAGQTDKYLSNSSPQDCVQNNITAFLALLEACRHFKIHHLTYASSHAVYGAGFQKPMSERDSANHPQRLDAATQRACELLAKFLLLPRQRVDGLFEIFRHHHLHAVAVEADQLAQEGGRQQILSGLILLLEDDLRQHRTGDVVAGLGVEDEEVLALLDHRREIFERHIGAGSGIIEPPVRIFLDGRRCL